VARIQLRQVGLIQNQHLGDIKQALRYSAAQPSWIRCSMTRKVIDGVNVIVKHEDIRDRRGQTT
jgi:hypothetical protein